MKGCKELYDDGQTKSGLYLTNLNDGKGEFQIFCDMHLEGSGWTIIQRRVDNTTSFNRSRKDYNIGFGDMDDGNFWLGLEKIKRITDCSSHELYIGLESFLTGTAQLAWARYGTFSLGTDATDYQITISNYDSASSAHDSLSANNGEKFSTFDEDNDSSPNHCGEDHSSGWWFDNCGQSYLNGIYYWDGVHPVGSPFNGIIWDSWLGQTKSLKTVVMAIRPV